VSVVCDPLTGSEPDAVRVIEAGHERMLEEGWDLAICITDLPIRKDGRPVVAAVSAARKVAVISLPPLGVTLLRQRVREAIVQLVSELYEKSPELGQDGEDRDDEGISVGSNAGEARRPDQRLRQLVTRRLSELISPIRRVTSTDDDDVDVRFVSPAVRGHLRLLAGMVLANRPWTLFSTMKSTLYGNLTAIIVLQLYIYISASIILFGAEVNEQIYREFVEEGQNGDEELQEPGPSHR
jgi:hypothetical protein